MSNRYVLKFSKGGYARYNSHLDLMRFFKRIFRRSGIKLKYSQGFNPHPKMSFAQPLSLGYGSTCDYLEFETENYYDPDEIFQRLESNMPDGIELQWCRINNMEAKVSLAALCESAEYEVIIPTVIDKDKLNYLASAYMDQDKILAMKRRKKDKKMVEVDIKNMIRSFNAYVGEDSESIILVMDLDAGSTSNCSPELVISSFCKFAHISVLRYEIDVVRTNIGISNNLQI
jgi:radical SAM-linked protein